MSVRGGAQLFSCNSSKNRGRLTARMIRINVLSFLERGEIISWSTLQGLTNMEFTVGSICSVSSVRADGTEYGRQTSEY